MATPTGIKQIGKPGGLVEPGIQKYGVMDWIDTAVDTYKKYKPLADAAVSLGKGYLDYKSQKELNELSEQAYKDYMAQKQAASQEAQAAIDLNLMPMEVTNVPTTKADVSDFTLVAARGGLMNLPTKQRKRYATGPGPALESEDISTIEEMNIPFDPKDEGVNVSPMVAFPDTGNPMTNAQQVWESGQIDQGIYQMDFELFFKSGDWMDYISKEEVQGDMQMAKNSYPFAPSNNPPYQPTQGAQDAAIQEIMAANGGIIGLRHGGRPGYKDSNIEEFQITESVEAPEGYYDISTRDELNPNEMLSEREEFWNEKFTPERGEHVQKFDKQRQEVYELAEAIMGGPEKISFTEAIKKAEEILLADSDWIIKEGKQKRIKYPFFHEQEESGTNRYDYLDEKAKGGRIRKAPGGIMNLGGLEKDYRTTGGFVPIGAYEKKDDVPARLSKNEFVMTADAVRAAGGGSINKGAQRMYDTMKHLEASPQAKRMTA